MPPSISEIARVVPVPDSRNSGRGTPHATEGYERLFNSVVRQLETARRGYHTSMTAFDLWPRVDFSGLPEDSRPNFPAFSTYLHNKARAGLLNSRHETEAERKVRLRNKPARFNRFATLFSDTSGSDVPEVKRRYSDHNPLTPMQRKFLELNPPVRDRDTKQEPVEFKRIDLDPHPEKEFDATIAERYEKSLAATDTQPQTQVKQETTRTAQVAKTSEYVDLENRYLKLANENLRLRAALNHLSIAVTELTNK